MRNASAADGNTGRESAGVAKPSSAAQMMVGSILDMYDERAIGFAHVSIVLRCNSDMVLELSDAETNKAIYKWAGQDILYRTPACSIGDLHVGLGMLSVLSMTSSCRAPRDLSFRTPVSSTGKIRCRSAIETLSR